MKTIYETIAAAKEYSDLTGNENDNIGWAEYAANVESARKETSATKSKKPWAYFWPKAFCVGLAKQVRRSTLTAVSSGSNPLSPAKTAVFPETAVYFFAFLSRYIIAFG